MWYFMLKSGVHATIAGVMLATAIPLAKQGRGTAKLISDILQKKTSELDSPAVFLEKSLLKWVSFFIIPVFAFANSGVTLNEIQFGQVSLGVIMGLLVGKPLGVAGVSWLAERFNIVERPKDISLSHLIGLGCLAGIGFTMSLFINSLAFTSHHLQNEAKIAILIGSLLSAVLGTTILSLRSAKPIS